MHVICMQPHMEDIHPVSCWPSIIALDVLPSLQMKLSPGVGGLWDPTLEQLFPFHLSLLSTYNDLPLNA